MPDCLLRLPHRAHDNSPSMTPLAEKNTPRACVLREMPLVPCGSLDDELPFVALEGYDSHSSAYANKALTEGSKYPRRQTLVPINAKSSSLNTCHDFPRQNDTGWSIARPTTGHSSVAVEVRDVLIAGGQKTNSSTTAKVPAQTVSAIERGHKALTETIQNIRNSVGREQTRTKND